MTVLDAYVSALRPLASELLRWYDSLPANKKYLLGFLKISWEAWLGTNFYFYPDGNAMREQPTANDPKNGTKASIQLGYNAACTLNLACNGTLTQDHVDTVLQKVFETIGAAILELGFPRNKLLIHAGANFGQMSSIYNVKFNGPDPALNTKTLPGWSFYHYAYDPRDAHGLNETLDKLNNTPWAACEWYYLGGNKGTAHKQWYDAIHNTVSFRNNRLIDIFNWESLRESPDAVAALQDIMSEDLVCLVQPVANVSCVHNTTSNQLCVIWEKTAHEIMLRVSTTPSYTYAGIFAGVDPTNVTSITEMCFPYEEGLQLNFDSSDCQPEQRYVSTFTLAFQEDECIAHQSG